MSNRSRFSTTLVAVLLSATVFVLSQDAGQAASRGGGSAGGTAGVGSGGTARGGPASNNGGQHNAEADLAVMAAPPQGRRPRVRVVDPGLWVARDPCPQGSYVIDEDGLLVGRHCDTRPVPTIADFWMP